MIETACGGARYDDRDDYGEDICRETRIRVTMVRIGVRKGSMEIILPGAKDGNDLGNADDGRVLAETRIEHVVTDAVDNDDTGYIR